MPTICFADGLCTRITASCTPPLLFKCAPGARSLADCGCVADPPIIVVPPPTVTCIPPLLWNGTACVPLTPEPPPIPPVPKCEVSFSFTANVPADPLIVSATEVPQCTAEATAIAMAILISRILPRP